MEDGMSESVKVIERIAIDVPAHEVYDVVVDFPNRYLFTEPDTLEQEKGRALPEVGRVDALDDGYLVSYCGRGLAEDVRYDVAYTGTRPTRPAWTFVEGRDVQDHRGSWTFKALSPNRAEVTYDIEMVVSDRYRVLTLILEDQSRNLLLKLKGYAEWLHAVDRR
jgi:hypothetical protein